MNSILKKQKGKCPDKNQKKRDRKGADKKLVANSNPEEIKIPIVKKAKTANVPVKRVRKPQGIFTDLPVDSVIAAKGAKGFADFDDLYNRPAAPPMFKEG